MLEPANFQLAANLNSKTDLPSNLSTKNHNKKSLPNRPSNDSITKTQNNSIKLHKNSTIKLPPFNNPILNINPKAIKIKPSPKKDRKTNQKMKEPKEVNKRTSNKKVKSKTKLKNQSLTIVKKGKKYVISSSKVKFYHL